MRKIKTPQKETPDIVQERDLFKTPKEAELDIIPFIKVRNIWECAAGEHHITNVLKECDFNVVSSDIRLPEINYICNFLKDAPPPEVQEWIDRGEPWMILTNPPYSIKKKFTFRCIEYDVPFALLIPADYSQWIIDVIVKYKCQKIVPYKRYNYITPSGKKGQAQFHSMWLTRYFMLEGSETFVKDGEVYS